VETNSGKSYTGDILVLSSQIVAEDSTRICISPAWGAFNYDAYFHHQGGENGYIQRWYIENGTASNVSDSVFMYNFDRTNTTETLTMSLYQNEFGLYPGVLSKLLRFYPGENTWRVVQMEKLERRTQIIN